METKTKFPPLPEMKPLSWKLLNEGFDSIVFSYVGENKKFKKKVLRMFKQPIKQGFLKIPDGQREAKVALLEKFVKRFMHNNLQDIDIGTPYSITKEFVEQMSETFEPLRLKWRRQESVIQENSRICQIHENHCSHGTYTVEIKPKCGFLPTSPIVSESSYKKHVSRFQMMQVTKLYTGDVKEISKYNPLDLFSGNIDRIWKAINDLANIPQRNLILWENGKKATIKKLNKQKIVDILYKGPHLSQILRIQKLDVLDIEGIALIADKVGKLSWNDLISDDDVVNGVQNMLKGKFKIPTTKDELIEFLNEADIVTLKVLIAAFLISTAAKDCSIMISFEGPELLNPKISIIDIDMKSTRGIVKKYLSKDQLIVKRYEEYIAKLN